MADVEIENAGELEKNESPENRLGGALDAVEKKDAGDPIISSGWAESVKNFWKDESGEDTEESAKVFAKVGGISVLGLAWLSYKIVKITCLLAKECIEKQGGSFGKGMEIAEKELMGGKKEK